jgi:hypothetical protein
VSTDVSRFVWSTGSASIGSETQDPITGMAFDGDFVWASCGPHALKYNRGKEVCAVMSTKRAPYSSLRKVGRLTNPLGTLITSPLVFGSHLLAITEDGRSLLSWEVSEQGEYPSRAICQKPQQILAKNYIARFISNLALSLHAFFIPLPI